nr:immunoglobulin light chain junction region [Macaca mulatta]
DYYCQVWDTSKYIF